MRKKQSAKDIAEKAKLIELSRALGQEPDPKLVSEVQKHLDFQSSLRQSIRSSLVQDLQKAITTTKQELDVALVQAEVVEPQAEFVALPPSLDDLEKLLGFSIDSIPDPVVQTVTAEPVAEIVQVEAEPEPESEAVVEQSLADLVSKSITDIVQKTPYDLPGTKKANSEVDAEVIRNADVQSLKRKLEELTRHLDRVNAKVDHAGGGGIDWVLTKLNNTAIGASTIFNFEGNGFQLDYDARINQSNIKMLGLDFFIWRYTISTVTDTVSGIDDFGATLTYVPGQISVYINGVRQKNGFDYTATNGTSIQFLDVDLEPTDHVEVQTWVGGFAGEAPGNIINITHPNRLVDGDYIVQSSDYYIGVNSNSNVTITLPEGGELASNGRTVIIKDESGRCQRYPIRVVGNIDNDPQGFILRINNGGVHLFYRDGWRII